MAMQRLRPQERPRDGRLRHGGNIEGQSQRDGDRQEQAPMSAPHVSGAAKGSELIQS